MSRCEEDQDRWDEDGDNAQVVKTMGEGSGLDLYPILSSSSSFATTPPSSLSSSESNGGLWLTGLLTFHQTPVPGSSASANTLLSPPLIAVCPSTH